MWRNTLKALVASRQYRTQGELVDALHAEGHEVSQGTVSRELANQQVRKLGGRYVPGQQRGLPPGVQVLEGAVTQGPLVVLKVGPALAPLLAQALDDARLSGILGTIAGENTVIVACTPDADLAALRAFVGHPLPKASPRA